MLSYLPSYYETSRVMQAILQAQGTELDKLRQALDETLNQFFVNTATWGLDKWEEELGLPITPEQPLDERRDKIISRIRGYGTATIYLIKSVASSYARGNVDVIEDVAFYKVIVRFIDARGTPPNLEDLKKALRDALPAHLDVIYEFVYCRWEDLLRTTWGAFQGTTWNDLAPRLWSDLAADAWGSYKGTTWQQIITLKL